MQNSLPVLRLAGCFLELFDPLYPLALAAQPHLEALAVVDFCLQNGVSFQILPGLAGGGELVQNRFQIGTGVRKANLHQRAAVHKLNSLAHFPFLKTVGIDHREVGVGNALVYNAVDAVDGRTCVLWVGEMRFVNSLNLGRQVKIILAEQNAHRFQRAYRIAAIHPHIGNFDDTMLLDGDAQIP